MLNIKVSFSGIKSTREILITINVKHIINGYVLVTTTRLSLSNSDFLYIQQELKKGSKTIIINDINRFSFEFETKSPCSAWIDFDMARTGTLMRITGINNSFLAHILTFMKMSFEEIADSQESYVESEY